MRLRCVHSSKEIPADHRVDASLSREGELLVARFEVHASSVFANREHPLDEPVWGLWEHDVVELFLRTSDDPRYYEFQVSPLGQGFELEIFEPRKRFNREFRSGFRRSARQLDERSWSARMEIPLPALGWDGREESLRGNLFAILGAPENRTYWSAFLPPQDVPDFHLPEQFRPLQALWTGV